MEKHITKKKQLTAEEKAEIACRAADSKKAMDIVCLRIRELSSIADYFLICSVSSTRQLHAVSDEIEKCLRKVGEKKYHIEGRRGEFWVLMDFADVVIHIFHEKKRLYFDLERLWGNAPKIEFGKTQD